MIAEEKRSGNKNNSMYALENALGHIEKNKGRAAFLRICVSSVYNIYNFVNGEHLNDKVHADEQTKRQNYPSFIPHPEEEYEAASAASVAAKDEASQIVPSTPS